MSEKKISPVVWIVGGCTVGIIVIGGFIAGILFIVFTAMRSNEPYKDGLAAAQKDKRVIEALGAPVEPGWFVSGQIKTTGRSGHANIDIPLKGSKQDGSLHVVGSKEGGRWSYHRMIMTPDRGEPIDLLAAPPGTASPDE